MHTDDDIFEDLNIDSDNENASGREDTVVFEDLNMEDRIFNSALDEEEISEETAEEIYEPKRRQKNKKSLLGSASKGSSHSEKKHTSHREPEKKKPLRELNTEDTSVDRKKFKKETEKKKKGRIRKFIIAAIVELFTLLAIFGYGYFLRNWSLIQRPDINEAAVENNNLSIEKKEEMERGYWTIAIFGVDSRNDNLVERGLNSDVIIIANINRENGDIKLVSVFRDTYLNISDKNLYTKINAAYAMGGPEQALAALNKNLDLNISNYICFNWKAVADGINILGGIDGISLSKAELYYINAYITETVKVTKIGSVQLKNTGEQHLDGVQAVAYARLRYMDNDFARTERQRNVIKACFQKAKTADFSVLNNIMVTCFPQVATNINFNEIVSMAQNISKYNIADTAGFPWSRGDAVIKGKGDCVVPTTLESNVIKLHEFLFDDAAYVPSDAVLKISAKIKEDSNLYKEGKFIDSVATDGGVIQKPKTPATKASDEGSDEEDESSSGKKSNKETIGIDENGNYIYPTDEDGNLIIPTDSHGDIIYPTDEDGNVIKESRNQRPTDAESLDMNESDTDDRPIDESSSRAAESESSLSPGETTRHHSNTESPGQSEETTTAAEGPSPGNNSQSSGSGDVISEGGPGSLTPTSSYGPGSETSAGSTSSASPGGATISDEPM